MFPYLKLMEWNGDTLKMQHPAELETLSLRSVLASWLCFFHPGTPFGLDWSQIFFWFSSSQAGGRAHKFPLEGWAWCQAASEQGRGFTLQCPGTETRVGSSSSLPACREIWAWQEGTCPELAPSPKGSLWAGEERGAANTEGAAGGALEEGSAMSRELGTCLGILRVTGVALGCASSWVYTSMASGTLGDRNGFQESEPSTPCCSASVCKTSVLYFTTVSHSWNFIWREAFPLILAESVWRLFGGIFFSYPSFY